MKKIFWIGAIGLLLFEAANVYFIMPMPGSQDMNSIDLAYFLYRWRWIFRGLFAVMILVGLFRSQWKRKWIPAIPLAFVFAVFYMANFVMAADHMFYQPKQLLLADASANQVDSGRLVIGVEHNGLAKAYPIRFLGYHHQVQDTLGGKPVIVTYCTVCRTGRVYEPVVDGRYEKFRLVGMDHFNAMFEDQRTRSWWRQVSGEAITGKQKGKRLPEILSLQTSLGEWLRIYPSSLIMQEDPAFRDSYDSTFKYESGASRSSLTGTDSLSWNRKSWVVGVRLGDATKAYDWNRLREERLIRDRLNDQEILLALSPDDRSFFAFLVPQTNWTYELRNDTITGGGRHFRIDGKGMDTSYSLQPVQASQEFWHSWQQFNPGTDRY